MSKRNHYISYIKGYAIIGVLLIHLIDWSNIILTPNEKLWRELTYPAVLFFISTVGSVVYIAYGHRDDWKKTSLRLITRGAQLIGIYFLYNLIKLWIYNFDKAPFYWQFKEKGIFDVKNIFLLHSFSVPITIILTIGVFLIISPLFLWLVKNVKYPKIIIGVILVLTLLLNYVIPPPSNALTDFLYARNNIMFPLALWFVPYLIGFYLAFLGFEKHKGKMFLLFAALTAIFYYPIFLRGDPWLPSQYMYPLQPYYICASFAFMYALIWVFWIMERFIFNRPLLSLIRLLGDHTLAIYIYHWVVIDLVLRYYFPDAKKIWIFGPLFVVVYVVLKRKKLREYYQEYSAT